MTTAIIVVTHNHATYVPRLARNLVATAADAEVVVVDNGSVDGTAEAARAALPHATVVEAPNHGFGAGCNRGARQTEADTLIFLNPDTAPEPGWTVALADVLREPTIGIASAETPYPGEARSQSRTLIRDAATVPAAALAIRRDVFQLLGGFDERLFLYWEDTDLCWRARLLGYRVVTVESAVVFHSRGSSGGARVWAPHQVRNGVIVCVSLLPKMVAGRVTMGLLARAAIYSLLNRSVAPLTAFVAAWPRALRRRSELAGLGPHRRADLGRDVVADRRRFTEARARRTVTHLRAGARNA